jgi:hypothetical protein
MPEEAVPSPYVGLRPFGEADRAYFFGRERESRVVTANVLEERLTVLYGPSGAGKSSILQAGVMPLLKSASDRVVYFRNWQTDSFLHELIEVCSNAAITIAPAGNARLEDMAGSTSSRLYLLLDQFEEYLMYHSSHGGGDSGQPEAANSFDSTLARLVNRQDSGVNVLIGIREDQISKLDQRFNIRIRDLFGNTLPVQRLDIESAKDAIRKPLNVFNSTPPAGGRTFEIEDELVEAILEQVRTGQTTASESSGKGESQTAKSANYVETAYLELVLSEVWRCEWRNGSTRLRYKTLSEMGGASCIVRNHVNSVMNNLPSDHHREIAACMFQYLVTPSRTKIAQRTEDLVLFAESAPSDVRAVLSELADKPETRILRRLPSPEQYEIFHDVLAEHILEWRRNREAQKREITLQEQHAAEAAKKQRELEQAQTVAEEQRRRAEAEAAIATEARKLEAAQLERADEQAAAAVRLRKTVRMLWLVAAVAVAMAALATVELIKARRLAQAENEILAKYNAAASQAAANALSAAAEKAQKEGNAEEAQRLRVQAEQAQVESKQARMANQQGLQSLQTLTDRLKKAEKDAADAQPQAQSDRRRAENAEKDRDQLKNQLSAAQDEISKLKAQIESNKKRLEVDQVGTSNGLHMIVTPDRANINQDCESIEQLQLNCKLTVGGRVSSADALEFSVRFTNKAPKPLFLQTEAWLFPAGLSFSPIVCKMTNPQGAVHRVTSLPPRSVDALLIRTGESVDALYICASEKYMKKRKQAVAESQYLFEHFQVFASFEGEPAVLRIEP